MRGEESEMLLYIAEYRQKIVQLENTVLSKQKTIDKLQRELALKSEQLLEVQGQRAVAEQEPAEDVEYLVTKVLEKSECIAEATNRLLELEQWIDKLAKCNRRLLAERDVAEDRLYTVLGWRPFAASGSI